jgi:hypothetical protein
MTMMFGRGAIAGPQPRSVFDRYNIGNKNDVRRRPIADREKLNKNAYAPVAQQDRASVS